MPLAGDYTLKTTRQDIDHAHHCNSCSSVVAALEEELVISARAGKDLLRQKSALMSEIDELNSQIQAITSSSHDLMKSNDELLQQSTQISLSLRTSESRIEDLSAELSETRQKLARMNMYVFQTLQLESQISILESEHEQLQLELSQVYGDKSQAEKRWRKSERTLQQLNTQYQALESKAAEFEPIEPIEPTDPSLEPAAGTPTRIRSTGRSHSYSLTLGSRDDDSDEAMTPSSSRNDDPTVQRFIGHLHGEVEHYKNTAAQLSRDFDHLLSESNSSSPKIEPTYKLSQSPAALWDPPSSPPSSLPIPSPTPTARLPAELDLVPVPPSFIAPTTTLYSDISATDTSFADSFEMNSQSANDTANTIDTSLDETSFVPSKPEGSSFVPASFFKSTPVAPTIGYNAEVASNRVERASPMRTKTSMAMLHAVVSKPALRRPELSPPPEGSGWAARIFSRLRPEPDSDPFDNSSFLNTLENDVR